MTNHRQPRLRKRRSSISSKKSNYVCIHTNFWGNLKPITAKLVKPIKNIQLFDDELCLCDTFKVKINYKVCTCFHNPIFTSNLCQDNFILFGVLNLGSNFTEKNHYILFYNLAYCFENTREYPLSSRNF